MKRHWPIVVLCLVGIAVHAGLFVLLESRIDAHDALMRHAHSWSWGWSRYGPGFYVAIAAGVLGWVMPVVLERQLGRIGWIILNQAVPLAALCVFGGFELAVFGPASATRPMLQTMAECGAIAAATAFMRSLIANYSWSKKAGTDRLAPARADVCE